MKKATGTKEWAEHNINFMKGCPHLCKYCYAHSDGLRWGRVKKGQWGKPEIVLSLFNKKFGKKNGTIMFPTTHDIHPNDLFETKVFLKKLLSPGNQVLIVSKPHPECIAELCNELGDYRDQILFRFTIGSAFDDVLKFWEPGAPSFDKRVEALYIAHIRGYKTSVSCEPMLDNDIGDVIGIVKDFVTDSIWLGKMNHLWRCKKNGHEGPEMDEALGNIRKWQSDANIKKLYDYYKDDPMIKWKESIKKVVDLELNSEVGMDT